MSDQFKGAIKIAEKYQRWAFVAGVIPIPLVDVAAVSGVNLNMLVELSKHYGVKFSEGQAKKIISSVLAGAVPTVTATSYVGSTIKALPGVGTVLGALMTPSFAFLGTYTLGRLFITHFEEGGTLEDLDAEKLTASVKGAVAEAAQKGEDAAAAVKGKAEKAARKGEDAAAAVKGKVKKALS